jgi:hypothetical protein
MVFKEDIIVFNKELKRRNIYSAILPEDRLPRLILLSLLNIKH